MRLTVGEPAKRTGLTVRTLHHYHAIGLLTPSARAENGYRLYGRDEIARLHQIQALSRFISVMNGPQSAVARSKAATHRG